MPAVAKDIFERLAKGRPAPAEEASKQPRRREDPKIFLKDILANGPAPVNLVIARGAEHGFSKRQITYAREQMKLVALERAREGRRLVLGSPTRQSGCPGAAGNTHRQFIGRRRTPLGTQWGVTRKQRKHELVDAPRYSFPDRFPWADGHQTTDLRSDQKRSTVIIHLKTLSQANLANLSILFFEKLDSGKTHVGFFATARAALKTYVCFSGHY